jgi:hypothetical protein
MEERKCVFMYFCCRNEIESRAGMMEGKGIPGRWIYSTKSENSSRHVT